jgi:hypothetical protein
MNTPELVECPDKSRDVALSTIYERKEKPAPFLMSVLSVVIGAGARYSRQLQPLKNRLNTFCRRRFGRSHQEFREGWTFGEGQCQFNDIHK